MSVARHLRINLAEYDRRIRTFIPGYEEMLERAAAPLATVREGATVIELGVGTGALARRCLERAPHVRFVGIDEDPAILAVARRRLRGRASAGLEFIEGDLRGSRFPRCDAMVASLALHHVRTPRAKRRLYSRCWQALTRGGLSINADAQPPSDPALRTLARSSWLDHLRDAYSTRQAIGFFVPGRRKTSTSHSTKSGACSKLPGSTWTYCGVRATSL